MEQTVRLTFKPKNNHILERMEEMGMNQRQMAQYLDISYQVLSDLINFRKLTPGEKKVSQIASRLNLEPGQVCPKWAEPVITLLNSTMISLDDDRVLYNPDMIEIPEFCYKNDFNKEMERILKRLSPNQSKILKMYFGVCGESEHNLEELSKILNKSRSCIGGTLHSALRRIRKLKSSDLLKKYLGT